MSWYLLGGASGAAQSVHTSLPLSLPAPPRIPFSELFAVPCVEKLPREVTLFSELLKHSHR